MLRTLKRKFFSSKNISFVVLAILLSTLLYFLGQLFVPMPLSSDIVEVEIPKGTSFRKAFDIIEQNGLVRDKHIMLILGKFTGLDRKIKAGYYAFWNNVMPITVLKKLLEGKILVRTVTIIEGETIWNIAEKLHNAEIMTEEAFFRLNADTEFLSSLDINAPSLEGYLFPSTYTFPKGTESEKVIRIMVNTLRSNLTEDMYEQMEQTGFSEKEALTLASIIEKEAVVDFERPIISAVYHNRLKKRMRLQADPTSIYGIKDYKYGITRKDLKRNNPYNTYRKRGLPPGPIANPGLASIVAALFPANVPYLYFVSKNNREHHFSRTVKEHFNAVRLYRSERRKLKNISKDDRT